MRDRAVISLPMGCFDPEKLEVMQDPNKGVRTKFSKTILTTLFRFDKKLLQIVLDWYKFLKEEKLFKDDDPFFPRTIVEQESVTQHAFTAKGIEPVFWENAGAMRKIFKDRATQQELDYYSPHKFRHFAISEAQKFVENAEQLKAVSQNVGHQNIGTTLYGYGIVDTYRVSKVITDMDFEKKKGNKKDLKNQLKTLLNQLESDD